jgi:hypothetical protein
MMTIARVLIFLVVCALIPGTATAQRSHEGSRRALAECQAKLNASPPFLALRHKLGSRASPDIVFSTDKATAEEAQQLRILLRDYIIPCHRFALEVAGAHPAMIPALLASQAQSDANYERLIAGQITWGQFMRDAKAIDAELDAEFDRYNSEPKN